MTTEDHNLDPVDEGYLYGHFRKNGKMFEKLKGYPTDDTLSSGWIPLYTSKDAVNRASRFIAGKASQMTLLIAELCALLPGTYYRHPSAGKTRSLMEQLKAMAEDAAKWRDQDAANKEAEEGAPRQVGNKAEVEPVAHLYKWIGDASDSYEGRVIARSVAELKGEIDMYPDSWERIGPLYAAPPATTGAIPEELATQCLNALAGRNPEAYKALSDFVTNGPVGASTVLTDERENCPNCYADREDSIGCADCDGTGTIAREVAAQAGQVAVPDRDMKIAVAVAEDVFRKYGYVLDNARLTEIINEVSPAKESK